MVSIHETFLLSIFVLYLFLRYFFHQQELELVNGKPPMVDKGLPVKFNKMLTEKGPQAQRVRIVV